MKRKPSQFERDVLWLAGSRDGRRILHRLIVGGGCFTSPARDDFSLGRESVGHEFLHVLAFQSPATLASLLTENRPDSNDRDGDDPRDDDPDDE